MFRVDAELTGNLTDPSSSTQSRVVKRYRLAIYSLLGNLNF